jgi:hypothetical protein
MGKRVADISATKKTAGSPTDGIPNQSRNSKKKCSNLYRPFRSLQVAGNDLPIPKYRALPAKRLSSIVFSKIWYFCLN